MTSELHIEFLCWESWLGEPGPIEQSLRLQFQC